MCVCVSYGKDCSKSVARSDQIRSVAQSCPTLCGPYLSFAWNSKKHQEKAMAPRSSTLAWRVPWMEEPGGQQSMGSLRVRHNWATSLSLFTFLHWKRKWQPTPVFLPGEFQGGGAWWAAVYGVAQSRTRLKRLSSSSSSSKKHHRAICHFWEGAKYVSTQKLVHECSSQPYS